MYNILSIYFNLSTPDFQAFYLRFSKFPSLHPLPFFYNNPRATKYGIKDANSIGRYNGEDVISLGIKKQQSSTAIEVSNQVTKKVQEIEQQYPGLKITVVDDASDTLKRSLSSVIQTLLLAIILSMIILFLFYGDLRASVIVGTSIPISVVLAIICMAAMGFSMNIISLTSLVLGVGMMVDNSINVLDGCFRAKEKLDFYDAALEGTRTMIGSITGGTLTTCVVFIPLQKPLQVEQAVLEALRTAGNPGRGAHEATLHASRLVYGARAAAQGGSGGALALAVSNEVWMMENATYSILSPEGFASILWKDAKRASEAAKVMKMTAEDLYELGMIERIICEDEPATDDNIEEIGRIIDRHMREFFQSCAEKTPDEIAEQRYERFRKI